MRSAEMKTAEKKRLMRLLHGELPPEEASRLENRLADDAGMRVAYERLAETWKRVPAPPETELPAGFASGVVASARRIRNGELSWSLAPAWARTGAAAALVVGLMLGAAFDGGFTGTAPVDEIADVYEDEDDDETADADAVPLTLSEVYWLALEESGGELATGEASTP